MNGSYQGYPAVSPASLQRAGLTLMVASPPPPVSGAPKKVPDKGWAKALGLKSTQKIDDATITKILDYLEKQIRKPTSEGGADPTPGVFNPLFEQSIRDWRAGTEKDLKKDWKGKILGTLPASPLDWGPNVRQGDIFKSGTILGDAIQNSPIKGALDAFGWITNPSHIVGILAIVIGAGLIIISYPKILGENAI